jgi:hypothetical protein
LLARDEADHNFEHQPLTASKSESRENPLLTLPDRPRTRKMAAALASKQQSLKIFEKLKTKPANKVRYFSFLLGLSLEEQALTCVDLL